MSLDICVSLVFVFTLSTLESVSVRVSLSVSGSSFFLYFLFLWEMGRETLRTLARDARRVMKMGSTCGPEPLVGVLVDRSHLNLLG